MACGTCGLGLLNAAREVFILGFGEPSLGLSSLFVRQLGELKARPVVLTPFWNGDFPGAKEPISQTKNWIYIVGIRPR